MTTIDDLPKKSISEMSIQEAHELLRQIRLSRRTPPKRKTKKATIKKASKPLSQTQAAQLLKILGG